MFASFYIPSILLSVENFDAFSHFDLDLSQPKKNLLLLQFKFVLPLLHSKFVVVGSNVVNFDDVVSIDFVNDVFLKS